MEKLVKFGPYLVVLGLGFGLAYFLVGGQKEAEFKAQQQVEQTNWDAERARFEAALAEARNRPPRIETVYREVPAAFTNKLTPEQILDKLVQLKFDELESRNQTFRKIIYYMQSLVEAEEYSFPAIRNFLQQNVDVDYSQFDFNAAGERVNTGRGSAFASRNQVRTDFLVPPSLRLGLLSVLSQIGGNDAEVMMGDLLATTARGVEVAFLARVLQDMRPDVYRDMAIQAAQELLSNPPPFESPNRLDENAKAYLYQVLSMYNDTTFANVAQNLVLTPEGKLDRFALTYLKDVLHEHAMPAILAAYNDPRMTNRTEQSKIINEAIEFTGPNENANQIFTRMVTDDSIPTGMRAYTIQSLAGNTQLDPPSDPTVIQARIQYLTALQAQLDNERLLKSVEVTQRKLEKLLSTQP